MTTKEEIQDEALRTTYPLALKRGYKKGKAEERERILEIIERRLINIETNSKWKRFERFKKSFNNLKSNISGEKEKSK